jgi:hypothetical protein
MFHLIYRILRGIILLPVAVVLMSLLVGSSHRNNYEDSQVEYNETIIDTQNTMEVTRGAYDRN